MDNLIAAEEKPVCGFVTRGVSHSCYRKARKGGGDDGDAGAWALMGCAS